MDLTGRKQLVLAGEIWPACCIYMAGRSSCLRTHGVPGRGFSGKQSNSIRLQIPFLVLRMYAKDYDHLQNVVHCCKRRDLSKSTDDGLYQRRILTEPHTVVIALPAHILSRSTLYSTLDVKKLRIPLLVPKKVYLLPRKEVYSVYLYLASSTCGPVDWVLVDTGTYVVQLQ
jgi:hypothetical protein